MYFKMSRETTGLSIQHGCVFTAEITITGKVSRDGILPELPSYRLPERFSVRPALRTQGEKGNGRSPELNSYFKCSYFHKSVMLLLHGDSGRTFTYMCRPLA